MHDPEHGKAGHISEARRLRAKGSVAAAYRRYRRAARLAPQDLDLAEPAGPSGLASREDSSSSRPDLAEEIGMFGATVLGHQWSRTWPVYLVRARADPSRRSRTDPILLQLARRLPSEGSIFLIAAAVTGMLAGVWAVRRFNPTCCELPPGVTPYPPIIGALAAVIAMAAFLGPLWMIVSPFERFGKDIVHQAFRPRLGNVMAMAAAVACAIFSLVVAALGGDHAAFEALSPWLAWSYLAAAILAVWATISARRR